MDVRSLAEKEGLPNANKKDSVGLCFVGKRHFPSFISQYVAPSPGRFVDLSTGQELGKHSGFGFYTIGQGAKIGGTNEKLFIAGKDENTNTIYVCEKNHPALWEDQINITDMHWIDGTLPDQLNKEPSMACQYKIRNHQAANVGVLKQLPDKSFSLKFNRPQCGIAPGQIAALYDLEEEICLGGGKITQTGHKYFVVHIPDENKFVIELGDSIAEICYRKINPNLWDLWHTEVPAQHRGKGLPDLLGKTAMAHVAVNDFKAILSCTYLKNRFLPANPQFLPYVVPA